MTKQEVIQVLEYCREKDFLGGLINILKETAGEEKIIVANKDFSSVHKAVMEYTKVDYPRETENEYGRIIRRFKEPYKLTFAFYPLKLEQILNTLNVPKYEYLRYAKATGKLVIANNRAYQINVAIDGKITSCYTFYVGEVLEACNTPEEETYVKLMQLFHENEFKFDKRGKNEYGRRVPGFAPKVCYALLPSKATELVNSVGGNMNSFISWAKANEKLIIDNNVNDNTHTIDFNNKMQKMYAILSA